MNPPIQWRANNPNDPTPPTEAQLRKSRARMSPTLNRLDAHSETTVIIGDNMDTDVVAGLEAGLETVLVLSGVSSAEEVDRHPYVPSRVVDSVADLVGELP